MPQMAPIYLLIMMIYFIFMLLMLVTLIYFFFCVTQSMKIMSIKTDNSLSWM